MPFFSFQYSPVWYLVEGLDGLIFPTSVPGTIYRHENVYIIVALACTGVRWCCINFNPAEHPRVPAWLIYAESGGQKTPSSTSPRDIIHNFARLFEWVI